MGRFKLLCRPRRRGLAALLITTAVLGGCGQKGPRMRPDEAPFRTPAAPPAATDDAAAEDGETENETDAR